YAPRPLTRDAPVGTVGDHVVDTVASPFWHPFDLSIDRSKRRLSKRGVAERTATPVWARTRAIKRDEPLGRGQEDDRVMAAPAVRVRVLERLAVPEALAFAQCLLDARVRVEHALTAEKLDGLKKVSTRSDRRVNLEAVLDTRVEVIAAVSRSRVDCTGA